jgi:hypothetical protein
MVYRRIDIAKDEVKTRLFNKGHYTSAQNENSEGQRSTEYLNDKFQRQDLDYPMIQSVKFNMKYNKVSFSILL